MKREVLKEVNNFIIFLFVFFYLGVLRVMENIIDFLRTKYFFYFVMALFLISNITYRKIVGKLKEELEYEINFKSKDEVWEMVKEERKKRNIKASAAWVAGKLELLSLIVLLGTLWLRIA